VHGAAGADYIGPEPEGCPVEAQGLGWPNTFVAARASTPSPAAWRRMDQRSDQVDNGYLDNLFKYDWELTTSPAGAQQ